MKLGIPKEIYPHERRVAATPETVDKIVKLGLEVLVESCAGEAASYLDAAYAEAGAKIVPTRPRSMASRTSCSRFDSRWPARPAGTKWTCSNRARR